VILIGLAVAAASAYATAEGEANKP